MKNGLILFLSLCLVGLAADKNDKNDNAAPEGAKKAPRYVPPLRGAPKVRVDGGSRGGTEELPVLMVIAPNHTGLTTEAQPTLVWFQSKPSPVRLEFALMSDAELVPLLETNLDGSLPGQFHTIKLADHKVSLTEGKEYRWSLAFVPDLDQRSKDLVASGRIERTAPTAELRSSLEGSTPSDRVFVFSKEGIWYDAIAALTGMIERDPNNKQLIEQRNALLTQVGLTNCVTK
jgi:hypothetical protein